MRGLQQFWARHLGVQGTILPSRPDLSAPKRGRDVYGGGCWRLSLGPGRRSLCQHSLVLVFEAWSPCPAQPCSRLDERPRQPTSLPRPESDLVQGAYDRPEWTPALLCWISWERHQAGCPGAPCRGQWKVTAHPRQQHWLPLPGAPTFSGPSIPQGPFPQCAPLHTPALF